MKNNNQVNGKSPVAGGAVKEEKKTETSEVTVNENGQLNGNEQETKSQESVEDKIKKINLLGELVRKRATMRTHLERIEALRIGDYDDKDSVTINTASNQSYVIKSSGLLKKFKKVAIEDISGHIDEVEAQLEF